MNGNWENLPLIPSSVETHRERDSIDCLTLRAGSFEIEGVTVRAGGVCAVKDCSVIVRVGSQGTEQIGTCPWLQDSVIAE